MSHPTWGVSGTLYSGPFLVQVGGTAVESLDGYSGDYSFPAGGNIATTSSPQIEVQALPHNFISGDRTLTLILNRSTNQAYGVNVATHQLTITDGDLGVYAGSLTPDDTSALDPQPIKVAFRSGPGATATAVVDATLSPLFQSGFSVPLTISSPGQYLPVSEVTGSVTNVPLNRIIQWTLKVLAPFAAVTNAPSGAPGPNGSGLSARFFFEPRWRNGTGSRGYLARHFDAQRHPLIESMKLKLLTGWSVIALLSPLATLLAGSFSRHLLG